VKPPLTLPRITSVVPAASVLAIGAAVTLGRDAESVAVHGAFAAVQGFGEMNEMGALTSVAPAELKVITEPTASVPALTEVTARLVPPETVPVKPALPTAP
jgi:hypothetical protein